MTILSTALTWGKFTVGSGGGLTEYPIVQAPLVEQHEHHAVEGGSATVRRSVKWSFTSMADAANEGAVPALKNTIQALAGIGRAVTVTENGPAGGTARVLPVPGTSGCMAGSPRVMVEIVGASGITVEFRVKAEAEFEGAADGDGMVSHEWTIDTRTSEFGVGTVVRRGSVRVEFGDSAAAWVESEVFDGARTAAEGAGRPFVTRVTVGVDGAACTYEYTDGPARAGGFGAGVTQAEVTDRTERSLEGRITRSVSGYAMGTGAADFIEDQVPDGPFVLTRRSISAARVPDGRRDFSFEGIGGAEVYGFDGVVISFRHEVEEIGGGREQAAAEYADADPLLFYRERRAFFYSERITVEFAGETFAGAEGSSLFPFTGALVEAALATRQRFRRGGGTLIRRLECVRVFVFDEAITVPEPLTLPGLDP